MIEQVSGLRLNPGEDPGILKKRAATVLKTDAAKLKYISLVKKSLDARKKNDIHYVCTVKVSDKPIERSFEPLSPVSGLTSEKRPVVCGFGPAGMFAALSLAHAGLKPVVIERGSDALTRKKAVDAFQAGGVLNPECNVQFGEGGAGTFSDGKLNTNTHDKRLKTVMETFYRHGAGEQVLYDAKPHIGTDVLINVVQSIRSEIISLGGEVLFNTKLSGIEYNGSGITGIKVCSAGGERSIETDTLVLAIGHSARDTFEMLLESGVKMEPKPFSMGARIEHLQSDIDLSQYGTARTDFNLPPADYSLNVHLPGGSSAYTFCMCPGGEVIAAASEEGGVCTNGMSYSGRNGKNANAALLVTLHVDDFPGTGVLSGMYWQREIERGAFSYGGGNYCAPAQKVGDFLNHVPSSASGKVEPTYKPGVIWGDIRDVLPVKLCDVLEAAIPELGKKMKGFDDPDAVLTVPECRSSSPVRIVRDESLQSSVKGLYPCGEGAGYAGGISSAAVDGLRIAAAIISCKTGAEML